LAAQALGARGPVSAGEKSERCKPRPGMKGVYDAIYKKYLDLDRRLK